MNKYIAFIRWTGVVVTLCLLLSGCGLFPTARVADTKTEIQTIELGSANEARVQINMAAGKLTVTGGSDTLLQATFQYNVADWQPQVEYSVNGSQGTLRVDQLGDGLPVGGTLVNDWQVRLSNAVPIDLQIETGAGEAELDLRGLDLTSLKIGTGAGNTDIDLSSVLDHDLRAAISGGVGDVSVKLPDGMGIQVLAEKGIGSLTSAGLVRDGDYYVNEAYGVASHTLYVNISAGVGAIELLTQ